jgi:hypothetical protein
LIDWHALASASVGDCASTFIAWRVRAGSSAFEVIEQAENPTTDAQFLQIVAKPKVGRLKED